MDQDEIEKIADLIVGLFVDEDYVWNCKHEEYDTVPAIRYLHCGCCSTTVPLDNVRMSGEEMISILTAVKSGIDREIEKITKAEGITRKLKNPEVY